MPKVGEGGEPRGVSFHPLVRGVGVGDLGSTSPDKYLYFERFYVRF